MNRFIILCLGFLLLMSCGHTEGTIQKAERSYLIFSGNLESVKVLVDDMDPFLPVTGKRYQIAPGKHALKAYRDGNLVLNRIIVLQSQIMTEINIP